MINKLKRFAGERGFTLIELLVVILIIGILIAIALPAFLNQQDKARDSEAQQNLSTAYKVAKSESVELDGDFPAGAALATAIDASEPQLDATSVAPGDGVVATWTALVVDSDIFINANVTAADGNDLELGTQSDSGTDFFLHVADGGGPTINETGQSAAP